MVRAIKYLFFLFFTLVVHFGAGAQNSEVSDLGTSFVRTSAPASTHEVALGFANNSARLDSSYGENGAALSEIEEFMHILLKGECGTRAIIIHGTASPLGNEEYNKRLALRRAEAVRDFLLSIEGGGNRIQIHAISNGEDWESFTRSILANYNRSNREEVLGIVRSDLSHDEKEAKLRTIDNSGETFRVLVSQHMAEARSAALIRIVEVADLIPATNPLTLDVEIEAPVLHLPQREELPLVAQPLSIVAQVESNITHTEPIETAKPTASSSIVAKQTSVEAVQPSVEAVQAPIASSQTPLLGEQSTVEAERVPIMALRSNLLVPALNIGVEVPIGTHWSVGADYYFPWIWPNRDNKNCFEFLGWGIEGRYWFGKNRTLTDRLRGHSVGLYGYMGYYDFERNYHGYQGEFVNVGLDYTYAMAVGKKKQLHFEFSLGVGYIYSQARKYTVIEPGSPLISDKITKHVGFFGPTKANISLVVPIFHKVKPNDKLRGDE